MKRLIPMFNPMYNMESVIPSIIQERMDNVLRFPRKGSQGGGKSTIASVFSSSKPERGTIPTVCLKRRNGLLAQKHVNTERKSSF